MAAPSTTRPARAPRPPSSTPSLFSSLPRPPRSTLFPYTTLFRSSSWTPAPWHWGPCSPSAAASRAPRARPWGSAAPACSTPPRSAEQTTELPSPTALVWPLLPTKTTRAPTSRSTASASPARWPAWRRPLRPGLPGRPVLLRQLRLCSQVCHDHRDLHSFPTRRSSDLHRGLRHLGAGGRAVHRRQLPGRRGHDPGVRRPRRVRRRLDRQSRRLNSRHRRRLCGLCCLQKQREHLHLGQPHPLHRPGGRHGGALYDPACPGAPSSFVNSVSVLKSATTTEIYTLSLHDALPIFIVDSGTLALGAVQSIGGSFQGAAGTTLGFGGPGVFDAASIGRADD